MENFKYFNVFRKHARKDISAKESSISRSSKHSNYILFLVLYTWRIWSVDTDISLLQPIFFNVYTIGNETLILTLNSSFISGRLDATCSPIVLSAENNEFWGKNGGSLAFVRIGIRRKNGVHWRTIIIMRNNRNRRRETGAKVEAGSRISKPPAIFFVVRPRSLISGPQWMIHTLQNRVLSTSCALKHFRESLSRFW